MTSYAGSCVVFPSGARYGDGVKLMSDMSHSGTEDIHYDARCRISGSFPLRARSSGGAILMSDMSDFVGHSIKRRVIARSGSTLLLFACIE